MNLRLQFVEGARRGTTVSIAPGGARAGREPGSGIQLDPETDREASRRHADFTLGPQGWTVRDLGSRNGTWVNGRRIGESTPIRAGDRIRFGVGGPEVIVHLTDAPLTEETARPPTRETRRTRRTRRAVPVAAVVLAAGVGAGVYFLARASNDDPAAVSAGEADLQSGDEFAGEDGFTEEDAPVGTGSEGTSASDAGGREPATSPSTTSADPPSTDPGAERGVERAVDPEPLADADVDRLRRELQEATTALQRLQLAGAFDPEVVEEANRPAIALIFVESAGGDVSTGTAFVVRPDGTLLTARHLVHPELDAPPPTRIGVRFADSSDLVPARLIASSTELDLAAIRVDGVTGALRTVRGFNTRPDTLGTGVVVASLGFPLGGALDADAATTARPLLTVGVLSGIEPDRIRVHGYGEVGASGSPFFDAAGEVVGMLYGGRPDGAAQELVGVGAVAMVRFLARLQPPES